MVHQFTKNKLRGIHLFFQLICDNFCSNHFYIRWPNNRQLYYKLPYDEGQSPYLYKFEDDQWFWFDSNSTIRIDFDKQIKTIRISKSNRTCDESNSNRFMQCMESYFSKQLDCILPWTLNNKQESHELKLCKGKDKFKEFRKITESILKPEGIKQFIKSILTKDFWTLLSCRISTISCQ